MEALVIFVLLFWWMCRILLKAAEPSDSNKKAEPIKIIDERLVRNVSSCFLAGAALVERSLSRNCDNSVEIGFCGERLFLQLYESSGSDDEVKYTPNLSPDSELGYKKQIPLTVEQYLSFRTLFSSDYIGSYGIEGFAELSGYIGRTYESYYEPVKQYLMKWDAARVSNAVNAGVGAAPMGFVFDDSHKKISFENKERGLHCNS